MCERARRSGHGHRPRGVRGGARVARRVWRGHGREGGRRRAEEAWVHVRVPARVPTSARREHALCSKHR